MRTVDPSWTGFILTQRENAHLCPSAISNCQFNPSCSSWTFIFIFLDASLRDLEGKHCSPHWDLRRRNPPWGLCPRLTSKCWLFCISSNIGTWIFVNITKGHMGKWWCPSFRENSFQLSVNVENPFRQWVASGERAFFVVAPYHWTLSTSKLAWCLPYLPGVKGNTCLFSQTFQQIYSLSNLFYAAFV